MRHSTGASRIRTTQLPKSTEKDSKRVKHTRTLLYGKQYYTPLWSFDSYLWVI